MSLFKGNLDSNNKFKANDDIRGLELIGIGDGIPTYFVFSTGHSTDVRYFYWTDNSGNLRQHTSAPTSAIVDSGGSVIAGSANAGASRTLDNLGTTAVNADVILNDNVNLSVGASADMTIDYDGTDVEIAFAAANTVVNFGQTNPSDLEIFGATGYNLYWDASADELIFYDNAVLWFGGTMGSNDGIFMYFDGTADFHIDGSTANDNVNFGATVDTDVVFHGGTAGSDATWIAANDTFSVLDDTHLAFGDADDMYLNWDGSHLHMLPLTAGTGQFRIGVDDDGIDVMFFSDTASDYMLWDADATNLASTALGALIFEDSFIRIAGGNNYDLAISTNDLVLDATDAATAHFILGTSGTNGLNVTFQSITGGDTVVFDAGAKTFTFTDVSPVMADDDLLLFGSAAGGDIAMAWQNSGSTLDITQVTDGTGSVDFIDLPVAITGADSAGTLLTVVGTDATTDSDTVVITHRGDGSALKISGTTDTAPTALIELVPVAATTTPVIWIDGDTNGWTGKDVTGMLHISDDTVHAHIGASMLYVDSAGQAKASATGHMARFVNTGAAQAGAVMVEIAAKDSTETALNVSAGTADFAHAATFTAGQQSSAVALTAAATNGVATPAGTTFVDVTSDSADKIVDLPVPVLGNVVYYMENTAAGYELAPQADTQYINNTLCGSAKELAIAAASLVKAICIVGGASGKWYVSYVGNDGEWNAGGTPN